MANVITTVVNFVTDGAQRSVKTLRQSVAEADGAVGKFKAGATSALSSVGLSVGTLAASGGAALVAFSAKAVAASQDVALSAGKLADATGLTVEQASRLNEVADDLGISGDTVTSVVKKMSVEIGKGNPLLEQYGIALQHTADGSADVNATLLDTIQRIGAIEDPTKRAAAAQAAFGRGYAEAAELIFSNADELQKRLDDVSNAKVVTPQQLKEAREFRDNLQDLKDKAEDLTVTTGRFLTPALSDLADEGIVAADGIGKLIGAVEDLGDALNDLPGAKGGGNAPSLTDFLIGQVDPVTQIKNIGGAIGDLRDEFDGTSDTAETFANQIDRGADSANHFVGPLTDVGDAAGDAAKEVEDLGDKAANAGPKIGNMAGALDDAEQRLSDLNDEARDNALNALAEAAKAVGDAVETAFDKVRDNLDLQDLVDNITDQFGEVADAEKEATDPEGIRNYNRTVRDLQRQLLTLLDSIKGIPPDKRIQIAAQIQSGDIDQLYRILGDLTKGIVIPVSFATPSTPAFSSANAVFTPGQAPSAPTFNQSAIPPQTINNVTINNPIGSTPTTRFIDGQTDFRRNGIR